MKEGSRGLIRQSGSDGAGIGVRNIGTDREQHAGFGSAAGHALPGITLPRGGAAIRGLDEKFSVNSSNGTGSFSLAIPSSSGRSGFTPSLTLSYDSGSGNGPFGFGWSCRLPEKSENAVAMAYSLAQVQSARPAGVTNGELFGTVIRQWKWETLTNPSLLGKPGGRAACRG